MNDKTQKAIKNNNGLYEAIFESRSIRYERTSDIWYSLSETPRLYSNLVTLSKDWRPDDSFREIDFNYENDNWSEWSIKDSFGVLDLTDHGFAKLFDAEWMYLDRANFQRGNNIPGLRHEILHDETALSFWRSAWDADEQLDKEIFSADLLKNANVFFIAGYLHDRIVNGCFINRTGDVLGISNFFAPDRNVNYWSNTIDFVFNSIGKVDIVGYERKETLRELASLGVESTNGLAVWLKKRQL